MDKCVNKQICEDGWESDRLQFRMLSLDDAEDMYEYASNEETCRFLKWGPYKDIGEARAFLLEKVASYKNPKDILFGIQPKKEVKLIGVIRIYNITEQSADLSYIQNSKFSGQGYMTETVKEMICLCFERLKLFRVQAYFAEGNIRSEKVMLNSGMKKDNTYESYEMIKGNKVRIYKYKIERE